MHGASRDAVNKVRPFYVYVLLILLVANPFYLLCLFSLFTKVGQTPLAIALQRANTEVALMLQKNTVFFILFLL